MPESIAHTGVPAILRFAPYRLALFVLLLGSFAAQKFVETRATGATKQSLGVAVSFAFWGLLFELAVCAWPRLLKEFRNSETDWERVTRIGFGLLAGAFLIGNLFSQYLKGYIACIAPPPVWVAPMMITLWAIWFLGLIWKWTVPGWDTLGLLALLIPVRIAAYWQHPFHSIGGDMLAVIDSTWHGLLVGRFPYIDEPPPAMPYWPGTFLFYGPAKLLGFDFRYMNLLAEIGTVLVVCRSSLPAFTRLALPTLLLFPALTYYSAETQYPISIFAAVLLGRAVHSGGPWSQALALGFAVATNQTFAAFGFFLLPFWIREFGWKKSIWQTLAALGMCLVIISPFLFWNPKEFIRVSLLSLTPFDSETLAGRFTWRPLFAGIDERLPTVMMLLSASAAIIFNAVMKPSRFAAMAAANLAYCAILLLLHRTFSHYFLPSMALALLYPRRTEISR